MPHCTTVTRCARATKSTRWPTSWWRRAVTTRMARLGSSRPSFTQSSKRPLLRLALSCFVEEPILACKPTFLGSKSTFGQFLSVISVDNGIGTWHSCLSARCGRSETTRRTRGCRGRIQQKSCRSHCTNVSNHPLWIVSNFSSFFINSSAIQ